MKPNQKIVLYMNDGVECGEYHSLFDAYNALKEIKESDKREHIEGNTYYFELEEESDNMVFVGCIKIYRRKNKIYAKRCEYPEYY